MIVNFNDDRTEDIYNGKNTKDARKCCPRDAWSTAQRKLDMLHGATRLSDLKSVGNSLEKLKHDRKGQHSIMLNEQFRICFIWTDQGPKSVEIVDYH